MAKKAKQEISFTERVLAVVRRIPAGSTFSYSQVARMADSPNAARAVGNIMRQNLDPSVPCHRVICADGSLGDYNRGGSVAKMRKLRSDGVVMD